MSLAFGLTFWEQALLAESKDAKKSTSADASSPSAAAEGVSSEDLHFYVVSFCLDMSVGKLEQAQTHVDELKKHGAVGAQAVEDFLVDELLDPALDSIPKPVLHGFLKQLRDQLA